MWATMVAGLMDIRDYARNDPPPPSAAFVDPGAPPPSFIFAAGQYGPPYDVTQPTMEPFPGCDAKYALLCAVQHAIRMVTKARTTFCPDLAAGGAQRQAALDRITAGEIIAEGTSGFGVLALLPNGTIIGDALRPGLIGQRFDGYLVSGLIPQGTLLDHIDYVTRWDGGFVPHLTTRLSKGPVDVLKGDAPLPASIYIEKCPTGERLGVAFGREPLPAMPLCNPKSNNLCAIQNIRRLVGKGLVDNLNMLYGTKNANLLFRSNYAGDAQVGSFYTIMNTLSYWGFPGSDPFRNPSPFADTPSTVFVNPITPALRGQNITNMGLGGEVFGIPKGAYIQGTNNRGGWTGGRWGTYQWNTPDLGPHFKIALAAGHMWNGTGYMFASGTVHLPDTRRKAANCKPCSADSALPCTTVNVQSLVGHAQAEFLTPDGQLSRLSDDEWFGAVHAGSISMPYNGTWPRGFYVFGFDYNGTCVVDGKTRSNVGKEASQLLGALHNKFKSVADNGGGWLQYSLADGIQRLAYVLKLAKFGRFYYLGSAFVKQRGAWHEDCRSHYSEPCAAVNAETLVGLANADIISTGNLTSLTSALQEIGSRSGAYAEQAVGDFKVQVFSDSWACPPSVPAQACPRTLPKIWIPTLQAAGGIEGGSWVLLPKVDQDQAQAAYVYRSTWAPSAGVSSVLMLVAFVKASPAPPRCDASSSGACPGNATCSSEGRCDCNPGFRSNFTLDSSFCGSLRPAEMTCEDVRGLDCSSGTCQPCAAGFFCSEGSPSPCPMGQYCPSGSAVPTVCPPGTFGNTVQAESLKSCTQCPAGTSQPQGGQIVCVDCEPGRAGSTVGATACDRCQVGGYEDVGKSMACKACPAPLTTPFQSATSLSNCMCPAGMFAPAGGPLRSTYGDGAGAHNATAGSCTACPQGMSCDFGSKVDNIELHSGDGSLPCPLVKPGFYTEASDPLSVYLCFGSDVRRCPGGLPGTCGGGLQGLVCQECPEGEALKDGQCVKCDSGPGVVIFVVLPIGLCILALLMFKFSNGPLTVDASIPMMLGELVGLCITLFQTLALFPGLSIHWRQQADVFHGFKVLLGEEDHMRVTCALTNSAAVLFAFRCILPLLCIAAVLVVWSIARLATKLMRGEGGFSVSIAINTTNQLFQSVFIAIAVLVPQPLRCYGHPNGKNTMTIFPEVLCWEEEGDHKKLVAMGAVVGIVFVVPFIAGCTWAVCRATKADAVHYRRWRFLLHRYRADVWWWGIVFLLRQLCLAFSTCMPADNPHWQITYVAVVTASYVAFLCAMWPWKTAILNYIDLFSMAVVNLIIISSGSMVPPSADVEVRSFVRLHVIIFATFLAFILVALGHAIYLAKVRGVFGTYGMHPKTQDTARAWCEFVKVSASLDPMVLDMCIGTFTEFDVEHLIKAMGAFQGIVNTFGERMHPRLMVCSHSRYDMDKIAKTVHASFVETERVASASVQTVGTIYI